MSKINEIVNGGTFDASDLSNTDVIDLLAAITLRKVTIGLDRDSGKLVATPSRRTVKAVQRAQASERIVKIQEIVKNELEKLRPQKVGPLVNAVVRELGGTPNDVRPDVLLACKMLRDQEGGLTQLNESESNFHAKWTLRDKPDAFPVQAQGETTSNVQADVEVPAVLEASGKKKPNKPVSPSEKAKAIVEAARKRDASKAASENSNEASAE